MTVGIKRNNYKKYISHAVQNKCKIKTLFKISAPWVGIAYYDNIRCHTLWIVKKLLV